MRFRLFKSITSALLATVAMGVSAEQIIIERFDTSSLALDYSLDGIKREGKVSIESLDPLPIPIIESNQKYVKILKSDGSEIWLMKRQLTTSELNGLEKKCALVASGDSSQKRTGGLRGIGEGCL